MKFALSVLVAVLASSVAEGAQQTYYVDQTMGNDGNDGSFGSPWASIQRCIDAPIAPGDTCFVNDGTYAAPNVTISGSSGSLITFQAESSATIINASARWRFNGEDYIEVNGFYMDGTLIEGNVGCSHVRLVDLVIDRNGGGPGLYNLNCDHVLYDGGLFREISDDPLRHGGDYWIVRNVTVVDEVDVFDNHMDFIQTLCVTYLPDAPNFLLIENVKYHRITGTNVHFYLFNQSGNCGSVQNQVYIQRYNQIRAIGSTFLSYPRGTGNGIIRVAAYNNTVMERDTTLAYSVELTHVDGQAAAINNVFYDSMGTGQVFGIAPAASSNDCNFAFDPDGTLYAQSGSGFAMDPNLVLNQDSLFRDYLGEDYTPAAGSPLIDSGCPLTTVAASDGGYGTTLMLDAAYLFQDGWVDGEPGDLIAVGTISNTRRITAIDYDTGAVTLESGISRADGDPVWLAARTDGTIVLSGGGPDRGAVELEDLSDSATEVTITGPRGPVNGPFTATITFSESVSGFVQSDVTVENATLENFVPVSGSAYTVNVIPTASPVILDVGSGVATVVSDGDSNAAAAQYSVAFDDVLPAVTLTGPAGPVSAAFTAIITFSEPVSGFAPDDIGTLNATLSGFAGGPDVYNVLVTPTGGTVTLEVPAGVAADWAGNANSAAPRYTVTVTFPPPVIDNFTATPSATAGSN